MLYLSSTTKQYFNNPNIFGCMFNVLKITGKQGVALQSGCVWMLENGMFSKKYRNNPKLWEIEVFPKWLKSLEKFKPYQATCMGVVVPDVPFNYRHTLERFLKYQSFVKQFNYKTCLVTQNGLPVDAVPWPLVDCLFIGGDNQHKRGSEGYTLCVEAVKQNKKIHIGRVNSGRCLSLFPFADSADGTTFSFHPTQQLNSIIKAVRNIQQIKRNFNNHTIIKNLFQQQENNYKQLRLI